MFPSFFNFIGNEAIFYPLFSFNVCINIGSTCALAWSVICFHVSTSQFPIDLAAIKRIIKTVLKKFIELTISLVFFSVFRITFCQMVLPTLRTIRSASMSYINSLVIYFMSRKLFAFDHCIAVNLLIIICSPNSSALELIL